MSSAWALSEIDRRVSNMMRIGVIAQVDDQAAKVRVQIGAILTDWLRWLTHRAGDDVSYWSPSVGEQVLLLSPNGDLNSGIVLPAIYQDKHNAPAKNRKIKRTVYSDGTTIEYDKENSTLTVDCVGSVIVKGAQTLTIDFGGDVLIKSPTVTIDSPQTEITGAVNVQGPITYNDGITGGGDVVADGVSLKTHQHGGVQGGSGTTGGPV